MTDWTGLMLLLIAPNKKLSVILNRNFEARGNQPLP